MGRALMCAALFVCPSAVVAQRSPHADAYSAANACLSRHDALPYIGTAERRDRSERLALCVSLSSEVRSDLRPNIVRRRFSFGQLDRPRTARMQYVPR